jgi:hypothetical protein
MSFIDVPTWKDDAWTSTVFETRDEFRDFVESIFDIPGKYDFDETSLIFNEQSRIFNKEGLYCTAPFKSKDFVEYWEDQKKKCRNGIIVHGKNRKIFYITRDYYMWLNFLPIFDKEEKKYGFAKIRDAQYHMALYEMLAELNYKHSAILKKRQIASSYFHMGKLINQFWFEEGSILKIGAALKDYINDKGSWKFLDEYRNFLNEHTAWYRPCSPDKVLIWEQKIQVRINNRITTRGLNSKIQGMSFEKDATTGVGGPVTYFFHEEAGIAPKMDKTYEYIRPAMQSGMMTTGMFIAAGSVGDLDQCEPLKQMILNPDVNDIYSVETDLLDADRTWGKSGLFIPEQWSMPPFIDDWGNSRVEEALAAIVEERIKWQKELAPEQFQLRISQKPTNIAEAFAYRKQSIFPINLVAAQSKRIEEKEYSVEFIDLQRDSNGKLVAERSRKLPISEFPISKKTEDKTGVLCVWERPDESPGFGTYYASIDPVSEGKTTTSDSLCSIFVYKNPVEVTRTTDNGVESFIERDKIVASWCGRYDDINKTHEMLENIVEWYNAWTIVENNVSLFIQHMIAKKKQRYLVPKSQILFLKDLGSNANVFQEYGWKNTGTLFKSHLISYAIEFLREELDVKTKSDGTIVKTTYGVERIPDMMLLKEMLAYHPGLNVDRLVAFSALVAFAKVQQSNRGYSKRTENTTKSLEKPDNLYKLKMSPFRHMGGRSIGTTENIRKSAFKNLK